MEDWVIVVKVGAEGGSIKLLGKIVSEKGWVFKKHINEIFSLDDEENYQDGNRPVRVINMRPNINNDIEFYSWEAAVDMLNKLYWLKLYPIIIHEEFHYKVWKEVLKHDFDINEADRWLEACYIIDPKIGRLSYLIKKSKCAVVLIGAGISTESGLEDFRSSQGRWRNIDPRLVASTEALESEYDLFQEFYTKRLQQVKEKEPNIGHRILADWQNKGFIGVILTQNVDCFHQLAGSKEVYELHGSIRSYRCNQCLEVTSADSFINKESCQYCEGKIRPNVVLFGESLPVETFEASIEAFMKADLVIVIGTSLQVFPVNTLPSLCKGKKVYINEEISAESNFFDINIKGRAGEILSEVNKVL